MRAPPSCNAAAHSFSVAAVVTTSSTSTRCWPRNEFLSTAAWNAPETLRFLSPGVNRVCVVVARPRTSISSRTGIPHRGAIWRASSALWLYPRSRSRDGESGTGTSAARSCSTSAGKRSAAIRRPIPVATALQPLYLRACTMAPAFPPGTPQTDRAARTYGGSRSHHAHAADR